MPDPDSCFSWQTTLWAVRNTRSTLEWLSESLFKITNPVGNVTLWEWNETLELYCYVIPGVMS